LRAGVEASTRYDARKRLLAQSVLLETALADGRLLDARRGKKISEPSLQWAVEVRDRLET
jgi:hypothetical protein